MLAVLIKFSNFGFKDEHDFVRNMEIDWSMIHQPERVLLKVSFLAWSGDHSSTRNRSKIKFSDKQSWEESEKSWSWKRGIKKGIF